MLSQLHSLFILLHRFTATNSNSSVKMGVLVDYFLNSSLHGLHFIADCRYHWTERVFWTLCVLASWSASLLLILNATDQYRSQKISFTVDTSYLHWKTDFPAIVVCERSNSKKMNEINRKNQRIFGDVVEHLPRLENFVFYDGTLRYKESCQVGGALREKCLLGNYSTYTKKIDRRVYLGYGNLSIELFHTGFHVYGLSRDAVPTKDNSKEYELVQSASKGLSPNVHYKSFLGIEEIFTNEDTRLLSVENRGCRFHDENNLQFSEIYSTSTCENECLINAQLEICNCSVHTLPHNGKVKECDFDSLLCIIENKEIARKSKTCKCTSSCSEVTVNNLGYTKTKINSKMFRDEKSEVRIDFIVQPPTIRYTRSVVKNPLTMLVGGTAGLFVGASLLTIIEIVYYFIIRPLGDKYLRKEKEKLVIQSKQQQMDFFDGCFFEYVN